MISDNMDEADKKGEGKFVDWTENPKLAKMMEEWEGLHWEGADRDRNKESLGGLYL